MNYYLKPIENDRELQAAIEQLEVLFDAPEGSPDAYQRDVLAILIEKYEDEHLSFDLPDPVEAIKFRMEQAGLSRKDLEPIIGSRSKVSEILSGKRELTLKMARALHSHLGIPAESLLGSSVRFDDELRNVDFDKFPVVEMAKNGAFRLIGIVDVKSQTEEAIRGLVELIGGPRAIPAGLFRKTTSSRVNAKLNTYALSAWCLQVLAEAQQLIAAPYQVGSITDQFLADLMHLSIHKDGPLLAQKALQAIGIKLVIVPHLKNTYLDGAAFMTQDGQPVIGLTLRYDKVDNFWFALFHEIGHIVLHLTEACGEFMVDDLSLRGTQTESDLERAADEFAEQHLLPTNFNLDERDLTTTFDVLSYAQENRISASIVAGRIQYKKQNFRIFANLLGRGEVAPLFRQSSLGSTPAKT